MEDKYFFEDIDSPIGKIFILEREEGICSILLSKDCKIKNIKKSLVPKNGLKFYKDIKKNLLSYLNGREKLKKFPIAYLSGTDFQKKIWKLLTKIPYGNKSNYSEIAKLIKRPYSQRAVGSAIGKNPIAIYIPCHRVIHKDGKLGGYAWGIPIKNKLLHIEEMADSI